MIPRDTPHTFSLHLADACSSTSKDTTVSSTDSGETIRWSSYPDPSGAYCLCWSWADAFACITSLSFPLRNICHFTAAYYLPWRLGDLPSSIRRCVRRRPSLCRLPYLASDIPPPRICLHRHFLVLRGNVRLSSTDLAYHHSVL
jgi:hypothetical protein